MIGLLALAAASASFAETELIDLMRLFTADDYAMDALHAGEQGDTYYRVTVSPEGRALDCTVTIASGVKQLDGIVCPRIMKRARFRPAKDAAGAPMFGIYRNRISWNIPGTRGPIRYINYDVVVHVVKLPAGMSSPTSVHVALRVGSDATIEECGATEPTLLPRLAAVACQQAKAMLQLKAARDGAGVAQPSVQSADIVFLQP